MPWPLSSCAKLWVRCLARWSLLVKRPTGPDQAALPSLLLRALKILPGELWQFHARCEYKIAPTWLLLYHAPARAVATSGARGTASLAPPHKRLFPAGLRPPNPHAT